MKMLSVILLLLASIHVAAYDNDTSLVVEETYDCEISGCVLACLTVRGDKQILANKARKVTIRNYPSGNVEYYFVERGLSNAVRILLGNGNLQCILSGLR